ncbi:hypothetical protein [Devosia sp. A369]
MVAAWVETLADRVGLKPKRVAPSRRPVPRAPAERPRGDVFEQRLEAIFEGTRPVAGRVVGGSLEFAGLSEIRSALGVTWDLVRERVRQITETELQRQLRPLDLYRIYSNSTYLLCLFDLSEAEARSRIGLISQSICDALVTEIPFIRGRIRPEHFVGTLNGGALHGVEGTLIDRLFNYTRTIKAEAQRKTAGSTRSLVDRSRVLFSPCWKRSKNVVALNRCILDARGRGHGQSRLAYGDYDEAAANLDFLMLSRAAKSLYEMKPSGRAAPVLIPVQYETLSNSRSFATYAALLAAIRGPYRRLIALQIVDIDSSHTPQAILEVVNRLSPQVKWLSLTFDLSDLRIAEAAQLPVWALATDLSNWRSTDGSVYQKLCQLRAVASAAGLNTIARGVDSVGLAQLGVKAGITYMDGSAIQPLSYSPRPISPLTATPFGFSSGDFMKRWHT